MTPPGIKRTFFVVMDNKNTLPTSMRRHTPCMSCHAPTQERIHRVLGTPLERVLAGVPDNVVAVAFPLCRSCEPRDELDGPGLVMALIVISVAMNMAGGDVAKLVDRGVTLQFEPRGAAR